MELREITFAIRLFNTLVCAGLIVYLVATFKKRIVYRKMNTAFLVVLAYVAILFLVTLTLGVPIDPIFSSIGASLNIFAIIIAVLSQVEH